MSRALVVILAFVGGWVDAASFVGIDNVMAAHITGNVVILAANLNEGFVASDLIKIVILPVFFGAVMFVTLIHDRIVTRHPNRGLHLPRLLFVEAAFIAPTGLIGVWITWEGLHLDFWLGLILVCPVVIGMAIQNAAHRLYPQIGPASTVMTGNITQFFIDRTRGLMGRRSVSKIDDMPASNWVVPGIIAAFIAGCALGAVATSHVGNVTFLVPAAAVLAGALLQRRLATSSANGDPLEEGRP